MDKDEKYKRKTHAGFFYSGGVGVLGGSGSGTSDSALRPAIADCSGSGADFREFRALRTCTRDDGGGTSRNCDCLCVVTGAWNFDGFVSGVMAPILIIYMGFGMAPKILTVVLMCFFPVAVSFADGLARVNEEYVHLVRSYGAGKWKAYWLVKIPAAIPELLSGMKVAATYSISGAVVGEWLGSQKGLGYYLLRVKNSYMLDKVFACVVFIIVLSLCMNGLTRLIAWVTMPYERKKTGVRAGK